jgi:hypothetical protein
MKRPWCCLNGHEWAKQQAAQRQIAFRALDNGFASCADCGALADTCGSLGHHDVQEYFDRWMRALPSPFTQAERGRYGYGLSVRQLEISDTRVFDRPAAGRAWFERTIADQLDLGRPDKVQIVFGRKVTSQPRITGSRSAAAGLNEAGFVGHYNGLDTVTEVELV